MNLAQLESELYDEVVYDQEPSPPVVRRLRAYLNRSQREILGLKGFNQLRQQTLLFSPRPCSPFAVLPKAAVRLLALVDVTNQVPLRDWTLQDMRRGDPGWTAVGNPYVFRVVSYSTPVAFDPIDPPCPLWVTVDHPSDVGKRAYVEGTRDGGYYISGQCDLTTTGARVISPDVADWMTVTKFYIGPSPAVGNVTLREKFAVGPELARITPEKVSQRYTRLELSPVPTTSDLVYAADVLLHIEDMVQATDEPYLPEDFHWLLVSGAKLKEYLRKEQADLYAAENAIWRRGIADLRVFLNTLADVAGPSGGACCDSPPAGAVGTVRTDDPCGCGCGCPETVRKLPNVGAVGIVIEGNGAPITPGLKAFVPVPVASVIRSVTLLADVPGDLVLDIWKAPYANHPPTVADTITAAAKPTLAAADQGLDATLTGWSKVINAGDVLAFNVDAAATVTKVTVSLTVQAL